MHILQTQKLNPGVNAGTDQLLTIMQQGTWNGSAGPRNPTVPAGGWKTRTLNPYILPKKMQRKWQAPSDEKLTNRIKTDSSHTVKGQKEKGKRSIWSETTILIVSCWPFHWTPVQDAWGQASAPARGHLQVADRPRLGHSSHPEVPQQESGRPGLASKCPGSIRSPGLAEGQRTPPRAPELFAQAPQRPPAFLCTLDRLWVSVGSLRLTCQGDAGFESVCPASWQVTLSGQFWHVPSSRLTESLLPGPGFQPSSVMKTRVLNLSNKLAWRDLCNWLFSPVFLL